MAVEIADTVAHLRRMAAERAARATRRCEELERWLPTAREILVARGATEVIVFGSLATGETTPESDLDVATRGLPSATYFEALGELMRTLPCAVDLVRLEEAPESLVERVRAEGRTL